jgi:hypothetical protein
MSYARSLEVEKSLNSYARYAIVFILRYFNIITFLREPLYAQL